MARLLVTFGFRSAQTKERTIWPGEYDQNDPGLYGLAEYLVSVGRAEWITPPEVAPVDPDGNIPPTAAARWTAFDNPDQMPDNYDAATKDELLAEVKHREIVMPDGGGSGETGGYLKADFIDMLLADDDAHKG